MSKFAEYKFKDSDSDEIVEARRVTESDGEDILTPGAVRVHADKGDFIVKIPASAYGVFEVVKAKDSGLIAVTSSNSRNS